MFRWTFLIGTLESRHVVVSAPAPLPACTLRAARTAPGSTPTKAPAIAWLVPLAGVVAIVGGVLPWFQADRLLQAPPPRVDRAHRPLPGRAAPSACSGPILLIVIGVLVLRTLIGSVGSRPGPSRARTRCAAWASWPCCSR